MTELITTIHQLKERFTRALSEVTTEEQLENLRIEFLGRNGLIAHLMPHLKNLALEEKHIVGPLMNDLKVYCQQLFNEKKEHFHKIASLKHLEKDRFFDVTAYQPYRQFGSLHPLTTMQRLIEDIFISMGFHSIEGPEVEDEYHNFQALNIGPDHPARDMFDTLWLNVPGLLLRTHTSSVQVHTLKQKKLPLAVIAPGRVFRHEATDATHDFMFQQVEGLCIDKNISLTDLLGILKLFFRTLFNKQELELRVRPSYFPFVEPGIEVDISCPFCTQGCSTCKQSCWIEIGGAGLIHPNVLTSAHIDPTQYSGFAFGFGLDRITMLYYGIHDIRLFSNNMVAFLQQF